MDDQAAAEIAPYMSAGEKMIWSGRAHPAVYAFYNGGGMALLGVFFAISWATSMESWRILFLIPALILFAVAAGRRGKSVRYGLTDKRAIIAATWPWHSLQSIPVNRFNVCIRQNYNDELASIMFRKTPAPWNIWRGTPFIAHAFHGIKDANKVEKLIETYSRRRAVEI